MTTKNADLTIRFWGTRGSLPSPGAETSLHGGNTSCVEVWAGDKLLILDAGSGLRALGNHLKKRQPIEAHLLLSHYHWDHIMGLPFFAPIYLPDNKIHIYGESRNGKDVLEILSNQTIQPYFPVSIKTHGKATTSVQPFSPGQTTEVGGVEVTACRLNHPGNALAYRLDYGGRSLVYATDTEPDPALDAQLAELAMGADALVYDATYTDKEYEDHVGWGHSTWQVGSSIAKKAGVGKLILFHHLPERSDQDLALIEKAAKDELSSTIAAREGMTLSFPSKKSS